MEGEVVRQIYPEEGAGAGAAVAEDHRQLCSSWEVEVGEGVQAG